MPAEGEAGNLIDLSTYRQRDGPGPKERYADFRSRRGRPRPRQRLDDRGVLGEYIAYLMGDLLVTTRNEDYEDQVWTLKLGGQRGHRRPDAKLAGFVTRGLHPHLTPPF